MGQAENPILIEGRNLVAPTGTGIATYARNLVQAVHAMGHQTDIVFGVNFAPKRDDPHYNEIQMYDWLVQSEPRRFRFVMEKTREALFARPFGMRPAEIANSAVIADPGMGAALATARKRYAALRLFESSGRHAVRYGRCMPLKLDQSYKMFHATHPAALAVRGCPNVYTIHDLIPMRMPHTTFDDKKKYISTVQAIARHADLIITVSENSRDDIIKYLGVPGERVVNTWQSAEIPLSLMMRPDVTVERDLAAHGLTAGDYFLFFGAIEPKKNIARLIDAFAASGSKRRLVILGGLGWAYKNDLMKIDEARFDRFRLTGDTITSDRRVLRIAHVPFHELVSLVSKARAVLFPSLYEGFGLPVLESMLMGTPVMTSNVSSLPEITGGAALLTDPYDTNAMASAIQKLDGDDALCAHLSACGRERADFFSTEKYQTRLSEAYRRVLS